MLHYLISFSDAVFPLIALIVFFLLWKKINGMENLIFYFFMAEFYSVWHYQFHVIPKDQQFIPVSLCSNRVVVDGLLYPGSFTSKKKYLVHAGSSYIKQELPGSGNATTLLLEDNGSGFDKSALDETKRELI